MGIYTDGKPRNLSFIQSIIKAIRDAWNKASEEEEWEQKLKDNLGKGLKDKKNAQS